MKKPTKKETQKVVTAVAKMFWANREDMPYVADKEYHFSNSYGEINAQEIHWEGGDYEWTSKFSAFFNDAQDEFYVEPYNGFVLSVWKREDFVKPAKPAPTMEERVALATAALDKFLAEHGEALGKVLESAAIEILTNPVRD